MESFVNITLCADKLTHNGWMNIEEHFITKEMRHTCTVNSVFQARLDFLASLCAKMYSPVIYTVV